MKRLPLDSSFSGDLLYFSRVCSHLEIVAAFLSILELVNFAVEYIAKTTSLHMTEVSAELYLFVQRLHHLSEYGLAFYNQSSERYFENKN